MTTRPEDFDMAAAVAATRAFMARKAEREALATIRAEQKAQDAARLASGHAALAAYYADSVGASVLADYEAGNVRTIVCGE